VDTRLGESVSASGCFARYSEGAVRCPEAASTEKFSLLAMVRAFEAAGLGIVHQRPREAQLFLSVAPGVLAQ
jgi:hypothetical protein